MRFAPILALLAPACSKDGGGDSEGCEVQVWYADGDGDGIGVADETHEACSLEDGYAAESGDCDDTEATVAPGLDEVCDGLDNDCNEQIDDGVGETYYPDADADGHGAEGAPGLVTCEAPVGQVTNADDCDDTNDTVFLGAPEVCDGLDNDCDDLGDLEDPDVELPTWYVDADADGYGDPKVSQSACTQPKGYVSDASDCDDTNATANPGASEICYDGFDNNCDKVDAEGCASCGDLALLAYVDWDSDTSYPIEVAAAELGAPITVFYAKQESGFAKEVAGAWADVVIFDSAWYSMDHHSGSILPTAVEDAIAGGALLIFDYWNLANHATLPTTLDVSSGDAFSYPRSIYGVDGSPIFGAVESLPEPMDGTDEIGIDGQINVGLDSKTSQVHATFDDDPSAPAIVSTFDGQVLVNGYSPIDFQIDSDDDKLREAVELYINELAWIANCAP